MGKKNIAILLCGVMLLSGCSNKTTPSSTTQNDSYVVEKDFTLSFAFGDRQGIYTGTIDENGLPDGFGCFKSTNDSGDNWTYYGEWVNGHFDGHGITQWDDYSHFGLYQSDYMDGIGMYCFSDGSMSCGEFKNSELITAYTSETNADDSSNVYDNVFSDKYLQTAVWAKVAFGDDVLYSEIGNMDDISGDYFQVIVPSNYTAENTTDIYEIIRTAYMTLNLIDTNYEIVSVKFISQGGNAILDIDFKGDGNGKYTLHTISGDLQNASVISEQLSNIAK